MAKMKAPAPKMVAKKDNTNVARKRVNLLVADKPTYSHMEALPDVISKRVGKITKEDSLRYNYGFREQIARDQIAGKLTKPHTSFYDQLDQGRQEASDRRRYGDLKKGSMVRDSSIPLAPTQFPD